MWQLKFKDNELLLISLQATIPSLQFIDKTIDNLQLKDIHKIIGNGIKKDNLENCSVSATAVSSITGIPRATCIRKLNKLVNLGFLVRINKNKRYLLNQITDERTKFILNNENVISTINTFSNYIAIIVNSLKHNKL